MPYSWQDPETKYSREDKSICKTLGCLDKFANMAFLLRTHRYLGIYEHHLCCACIHYGTGTRTRSDGRYKRGYRQSWHTRQLRNETRPSNPHNHLVRCKVTPIQHIKMVNESFNFKIFLNIKVELIRTEKNVSILF